MIVLFLIIWLFMYLANEAKFMHYIFFNWLYVKEDERSYSIFAFIVS